jgi:hypothetical protein
LQSFIHYCSVYFKVWWDTCWPTADLQDRSSQGIRSKVYHSGDWECWRAPASLQECLRIARFPWRWCTLGRSDAADDRRWPSTLTALPLCEFPISFLQRCTWPILCLYHSLGLFWTGCMHAVSRRSRGLLLFNCYPSPCHFLCFILFLHSSLNVPSVPFFFCSRWGLHRLLRRLGVPNCDILEIHSNLFCLQCFESFSMYVCGYMLCCTEYSLRSSKYRSGPMGTPYMAQGWPLFNWASYCCFCLFISSILIFPCISRYPSSWNQLSVIITFAIIILRVSKCPTRLLSPPPSQGRDT